MHPVGPFVLVLVASAAVLLGFTALAVRHRTVRGATGMIGLLLAALAMTVGQTGELLATDVDAMLAWNALRFVGAACLGPTLLGFALEYTADRDALTRRQYAALLVVPAATTAVLLLAPDLFYGGVSVTPVLDLSRVAQPSGPWFVVHMVYAYGLVLGATAVLVAAYLRARGNLVYRGQLRLMLLGGVLAWVVNVVSVLRLVPVDLTAVSFAVDCAFIAAAVFRYQFLDVAPIARSVAVEHLDGGVVVLDRRGRVVDANPYAETVLGRSETALVGAAADDLGDAGALLAANDDATLVRNGETRHYDVRHSPIQDSEGGAVGTVVLFRDTTRERERADALAARTTELERQNERLDEFAGVVSHDLRNPLNVLTGSLSLARGDDDPAHFDRMDSAARRMNAIIDDALSLARQGGTVQDREPVDLAALATAAWAQVDTGDAELDASDAPVVLGDWRRLQLAFENLFRNAVEHGGEDVIVTVGPLADGFFVEDDGPGVSPDLRGGVFERGVTTNRDGTGFGLAIVEAAVEAHGWTVVVGESAHGGARFEIVGETRPVRPETAT